MAGVVVAGSWVLMWYVDKEDSEEELREQEEWMRKEKLISKTVLGKVKEFVLYVSMTSFFGNSISGKETLLRIFFRIFLTQRIKKILPIFFLLFK